MFPPLFTPLSIAKDKDLVHTPSVHSFLSFSLSSLLVCTHWQGKGQKELEG